MLLIKRRMLLMVWLGTIVGLLLSVVIGAGFLAVWFKYANNLWENTEALWEACFSLLAGVLIGIMGFVFLNSEDLSRKWTKKIRKQLKAQGHRFTVANGESYSSAGAAVGGIGARAAESSAHSTAAATSSAKDAFLTVQTQDHAISDNNNNKDAVFIMNTDPATESDYIYTKQMDAQIEMKDDEDTSILSTSSGTSFMKTVWMRCKDFCLSVKQRMMRDRQDAFYGGASADDAARAAPVDEDNDDIEDDEENGVEDGANNPTFTDDHNQNSTIPHTDLYSLNSTIMRGMFAIPFVTVVREGLEGMIFLGGVGISSDPGSIPIAACVGILVGCLIGVFIFKLGSSVKLRVFFVASAIFLFFLSSGLLVAATLKFQSYRWIQRIGGSGDGDEGGTYDIFSTVFRLDDRYAPGYFNYGYSLLNSVIGWDNWGTYASVCLYVFYWLGLSALLVAIKMRREMKLRGNKD